MRPEALLTQRLLPPRSCHLQLSIKPANGGAMPSDGYILYALVDPVSPP